MITESQTREVIGSTAYSTDGDKLGKVGQLFLDDQTGRPEFVTVNTGLFGTNETFIPIAEADFNGDRLTVPFTKDQVKDAPNVAAEGGHLDPDEEQRLYQHYSIADPFDSADYAGTGTGTDTGYETGTVGHDVSGPETDEAMTRSEERLQVGKTEQEAGRVRLRKYVTTDTETETVPVRKERATIEREPITDGNVGEALDGPAISEEEHEVVLHEERAVADTTAEPVERVRVGKETVTEQETVSGEVRKEQIEVDGEIDERR